MRYIQLIAFFFFMAFASLCGGNQALHALNVQQDYSARLNLSFLEGRCNLERKNEFRYNWGVCIHTDQLFPVIPVIFKTGNISSGGIVSRLNSPELSPVLGTSAGQIKPAVLEASLPSWNSFSKPVAWFLQGGYSSKKTDIKTARISIFADKQHFTGSLDFKFIFKKSITTTLCLTGGFYPYKQSEVSSWFNDACFYHPGSHVCMGSQLSVSSKNAGTLWIINAYESPSGKFLPVFRTENYFKHKNFSMNLNAFYNQNENVITSSGKTLSPKLQLKTTLNYQFLNGIKTPVIIKNSFSTQADIKLNSDTHNLKTAAGIKFTGEINTVNIVAKASFNVKKLNKSTAITFSNGNIDLSFGTVVRNFKPEFSAKFTFETDDNKQKWNFSQKAGINLRYYGIIELTNNNTLTFLQKNYSAVNPSNLKKDINFSSAIGIKTVIKDLSLAMNITFEI